MNPSNEDYLKVTIVLQTIRTNLRTEVRSWFMKSTNRLLASKAVSNGNECIKTLNFSVPYRRYFS